MEHLIKEAFLHIEFIGPHVAEGHYDLVNAEGQIVLPHVWEEVVEPDWTISMQLWPLAEEKEEEPAVDALPQEVVVLEEGMPHHALHHLPLEDCKRRCAPGYLLLTLDRYKSQEKGGPASEYVLERQQI